MKIRLFVITLFICVFANQSSFAQLRYYAGAGYKFQYVTKNIESLFVTNDCELANQLQLQAGVKKHWNRIGGDISIGYFKNEFDAYDSDNLHYMFIEPQFSWRWFGAEPKNIFQTLTTNVGWKKSFLVGDTKNPFINKNLNFITLKFMWDYKFLSPYISFGKSIDYFYSYHFSVGSADNINTIKFKGNYMQIGVNMVIPYKK